MDFITDMSKGYFSFLLRIFRPGNSETSPWKASLQDTRSMQVHHFQDLQELDQFLKKVIGEPGGPDEPQADSPSVNMDS
jgi:hypothetical protein